jgi:hypothetical protein
MRWYGDYYYYNLDQKKRMSLMDYIWSSMHTDQYCADLIDSALDEVAPKQVFKVINKKTVRRNGKVYRVTVEELTSEVSEDTDTEEPSEDSA